MAEKEYTLEILTYNNRFGYQEYKTVTVSKDRKQRELLRNVDDARAERNLYLLGMRIAPVLFLIFLGAIIVGGSGIFVQGVSTGLIVLGIFLMFGSIALTGFFATQYYSDKKPKLVKAERKYEDFLLDEE